MKMKKNFHSHTFRCGHAFQTEREYLDTAIAEGFNEFGFSDHSPYIFPAEVNYYSSFRMPVDAAADYVETVNALKEEYKDKIKVCLGYELEYYPSCFEQTYKFLESYGFDYLILGQHFSFNEYDGVYSYNCTDNVDHFRNYTDQVIEAMKTGLFAYVAHPDLFRFKGDEGIYREEAQRLCEAAVKYNVPLEINMLGLRDNRDYPNEKFWEIAGNIDGVKAILGLDAHSVNCIINSECGRKGFELANKYGLELIEKPDRIRG